MRSSTVGLNTFAIAFAGSHQYDLGKYIALSIRSVPPNRRLAADSVLPRSCRGGADHFSCRMRHVSAAGTAVGDEARRIDAA